MISIFLAFFSCFILIMIFVIGEYMSLPTAWEGLSNYDVWTRPIIITVGTMAGFLSKSLADELVSAPDSKIQITKILKDAFRTRSLWLAIALAPLVLLTFYRSISEVSSISLVLLLAYQNAFFFRSLIGYAEGLTSQNS